MQLVSWPWTGHSYIQSYACCNRSIFPPIVVVNASTLPRAIASSASPRQQEGWKAREKGADLGWIVEPPTRSRVSGGWLLVLRSSITNKTTNGIVDGCILQDLCSTSGPGPMLNIFGVCSGSPVPPCMEYSMYPGGAALYLFTGSTCSGWDCYSRPKPDLGKRGPRRCDQKW